VLLLLLLFGFPPAWFPILWSTIFPEFWKFLNAAAAATATV
jgi:hypothetical protein